jgi:UDP:flavonoid glycosyltransferase YjiC (YdhE family)
VTDNRVLWDLDAKSINALFGAALNTHRAAVGLPTVDDVRDHVIGDRPWLATDPILDPWRETPDLDVVRTGAWILPDERPLPAELVAFLDAGTPPVYVGFGSMPMRASAGIARVAVEAIRAQVRRVPARTAGRHRVREGRAVRGHRRPGHRPRVITRRTGRRPASRRGGVTSAGRPAEHQVGPGV